jgi:hypothetical protein
MSYSLIPTADYKAACDAIRAKTGKTDLIKSGDMAAEIASVPTGGGGGVEGVTVFTTDLSGYWGSYIPDDILSDLLANKVRYEMALTPITRSCTYTDPATGETVTKDVDFTLSGYVYSRHFKYYNQTRKNLHILINACTHITDDTVTFYYGASATLGNNFENATRSVIDEAALQFQFHAFSSNFGGSSVDYTFVEWNSDYINSNTHKPPMPAGVKVIFYNRTELA